MAFPDPPEVALVLRSARPLFTGELHAAIHAWLTTRSLAVASMATPARITTVRSSML